MKKEINIKQFFAFILLACYFLLLSPFFISHDHDHDHDHDHVQELYCENTHNDLDNHLNCSHKEHITNLKEKCLLCNFPVVFDHVFSSHIIKPENRFLLEKNSPLYERVYFQEFINYSNKSPPVLI